MLRPSYAPALVPFLVLISCGGGSTNPPSDVPPVDNAPPADVVEDAADAPPDEGRDFGEPETDLGPDAPEPGEFLAPCSTNRDCISGFCVEGPQGNICTKLCLTEECPADFVCSGIVNTFPDTTFICIPKFGKVCSPCSTDSQCAGGRCVETADGKFCSVTCSAGECPDPYRCTPVGDGTESFCLPPSNNCLCRASDAGVKRLCQITTEGIGTCYGYEQCDPEAGFVGCDARTPADETCNGIDDDCDGTPDDGLPSGEACTVDNEFGTCAGLNACLGPAGYVCSAQTPAEEACNGIDDDCSGEADDPFKVGGIYATLEHCGACNRSCVDLFPNGTPACDLTGAAPRCIVTSCNAGYYKLNDFQCIPLTSLLCSPCEGDADCIKEGSRCITVGVDGGKYCGQQCAGDADCPTSFSCLPAEGGPDQCQPQSGTCSCTGASQGVSRGCSATYAAPGQPSYTCFGTQACQASGWGPCVLPDEECNGLDDNCDGTLDEGFLEPGTNRYVDDRNCGVCGNNCTTQTIANGHGVCDTARTIPDCKVVCNEGFFNVDGNPANGCECAFAAGPDLPGGGDTNCDGIDGEVTAGVFVARWGSDANPGTIDAPLLGVKAGLQKAVENGKRDVYVATGVYTESVALRAAVGLYGGFSADFRVREPLAYETVLLGPAPTADAPGAVNALGLSGGTAGTTVLDGFVVIGSNNRVPGGSSIGIYLRDCDATVAVRNNRVVGGQGGDGRPGVPGASGASGGAGVAGLDAKDADGNCGNADHSAGGAAGANTCGGVNVSGGAGGNAVCPEWDEGDPDCPEGQDQARQAEERGSDGLNNGGGAGAGGVAGLDAWISANDYGYVEVFPTVFVCATQARTCGLCTVPNESKGGANGLPGTVGPNGSEGTACTGAGSVVSGVWTAARGADGADGAHGGGGGGGGAAGGVETRDCNASRGNSDIGGSGGGGGAGGCAAAGGTAGGSGGGSFAIFVTFGTTPASLPTVADSLVEGGQGGDGGSGGNGGVGGRGGTGGVGGADGASNEQTFCASGGGVGGDGGPGGHGGGGGGGCGGPAYGLYVAGAAAGQADAYKAANLSFTSNGTGGQGGFGGGSLGNPGADGAVGSAGQMNF